MSRGLGRRQRVVLGIAQAVAAEAPDDPEKWWFRVSDAAPDGIRSTHWLLAASRIPAIEYKHGLARLDPESPLGRVYRRVPFGAG
jgi:hypothetical protein